MRGDGYLGGVEAPRGGHECFVVLGAARSVFERFADREGKAVAHGGTAGEVQLRRARRSETLQIEEVAPTAAAPVLRRYLQQVRVVRPFFDVTPTSPLEAFEGEAPRHPVFRLTTDSSS